MSKETIEKHNNTRYGKKKELEWSGRQDERKTQYSKISKQHTRGRKKGKNEQAR